jgi:DNA-binding SARP family transcriptional activator
VDLRLLGPVEVRTDGPPLSIPGARQRALLALLLLQRGAAVSRDRLIEELWNGRATAGADKALQVAVSRLRRALGPAGGRLATTPGGYRLRVEPGELDLDRFERLAEEGRRELATGAFERAAARLRAALQEWRGPALADVAFEPFAQAAAVQLEAQRDAALEDRIEADLGLGRHGELVPELEALVARDPLRERARGQLMLALYRSGRQGDALDIYRDGARLLADELGLRPGPELARLERAILDHDAALDRGRPLTARAEPEPRRATATILFSDLADSTGMRLRLGDEAADRVRREHDRRLRDVLGLHGGREVKALGDGVMAVCDAAGDAVACAIDMQRAIDRQSDRGGVVLGLRIGIAAGDVAWEGDDCFGTPVVEAQRLCAAAAPGRILVADAVRLLAGGDRAAELRDAGELALRGFEHPVRAWEVMWAAERSVSIPLAGALDVGGAFAGRETELALVRGAWDAATGGARRAVLVTGEPGIGKTRLAAELGAHARSQNGVVLYGRCDEGLAAPAQPFAEALGAYAAACPIDELRVQLGRRAGDLLPILPALVQRLPGVAEPEPAEPDVERLRAFEAAVALLEAAASSARVLLVLDDLHWADELSLLLLRHVLRTEMAARLLVLATYRDTEPSRSPLLADVVTGLARQPDVIRIELGPLAEPDVAALLAYAGRDRTLAAGVRATTHGNPFFVAEVVRALGEEADPGTAITPRARDVVRGRLARLPSGVADLLAVAAVAGPEFDVDVVAAAGGVETERTLDILEAAELAGLVRSTGSFDRFGFTHALVRQAIVDDLPAGRRVRMHARVAHALEGAAGERAVAASDLAAHFDAAGGLVDAERTLEHARRAADEAAERLAFDVAAEQYARALRAHARFPDPPVAQRRGLELARGRALRLAGDERAHGVLRALAAEAEAARDGAGMAEALLTLGIGTETDFLHEDAGVIALLRRALALLPPDDDADRARLLGCLALQSLHSVSDAERRALAGRAVALARRSGDVAALASALAAHSWTVMDPERVRERLAIADELVEIAPRGSPYGECEGHVFRYLALVEAGDLAGADAALASARAAARLPIPHWTVRQWEATRAMLAGRLDDAEAAAVSGVEAAQATGAPPRVVQFSFASLMWCIRLTQGRLLELQPLATAALAMTDRPAWTYVSEAQLARERDDRAAAAACFETALAHGLLDLPRGVSWATTMTFAADLAAWLEHSDGAERLHALLAPCAGAMIAQVGSLARPVGVLALALGRPEEAERRLRDAVALCVRMDAQAHLAFARLELGRLLLPAAEGRALVEQAAQAADRLGLLGVRASAAAALRAAQVL